MNTSIQLAINEVLAMSPDVSRYIHDQTRKRRIPIDQSSEPNATAATISSTTTIAGPEYTKRYYAHPSARAKVTLNDELTIPQALLDNGSELNIVPKRTVDQLSYPIDVDVQWVINGYNEKAKSELKTWKDEGEVLGVMHDVNVDVGGVSVLNHLFVVAHCDSDLILGRPWETTARVQYTNEDDGSYTVRLKSPDNLRMVEFVAAPSRHERDREFVRTISTSDLNSDYLKV